MILKKTGYTVVMGMGTTGVACVRFLSKENYRLIVMDNRPNPSNLSLLHAEFPHLTCHVGSFDAAVLAHATQIILSPGLSLELPELQLARQAGIPILSEIELFAHAANAPIISITGSNGKSTVTTLVGEMAKHAGLRVQVGGNLGIPALDLLCDPPPDVYVLELSSFQLETTYSLHSQVATVLNVTEDHMDRYASIVQYAAAKERVFHHSDLMILNADDPIVMSMRNSGQQYLTFGIQGNSHFTVGEFEGDSYLVQWQGNKVTPLLALQALPNALMPINALAALALGKGFGLPLPAMLAAIKAFNGLPHRCTFVARINEVEWIDDSKGTNVGATVAAIQGLRRPKRIILIAGGDGKSADFTPLTPVANEHLKACVLIGRDAPTIAAVLEGIVPLAFADTLPDAVRQCATLATAGDVVLLSPACASLDMFKNYVHRGEVFVEAVRELDKH